MLNHKRIYSAQDLTHIVKRVMNTEQKNLKYKFDVLKIQFENFRHEMQKMELRLVIKTGSLLTVAVGIIISYVNM